MHACAGRSSARKSSGSCKVKSELCAALFRPNDFPERGEQPVHFFDGVVVYEPDAEEASGLFHVEMLGEVQSVVVPIPCKEAAVAEFGREFERSVAVDADGEGTAAVVKSRGISDAVDLCFREFL